MLKLFGRELVVMTGLTLMATLTMGGCRPASQDLPAPLPSSQLRSLQQSKIHYVALGDSYASAPGVRRSRWAQGCERSTNNYPALVAREVRADQFSDVTCLGAQTSHVSTPQPHRNGKAQMEALHQDTTLVTVNFGGNNGKLFHRLITTCTRLAASDRQGSPCEDLLATGEQNDPMHLAQQVESDMVNVVTLIRQRSPRAQVMVVGYPLLLPSRLPQQGCSRVRVAKGDYSYISRVNQQLNDSLQAAARRTRSTYIDVQKASQGHDICSKDPWINNASTDVGRAAPFHPYRAEQTAVALLIMRAIE